MFEGVSNMCKQFPLQPYWLKVSTISVNSSCNKTAISSFCVCVCVMLHRPTQSTLHSANNYQRGICREAGAAASCYTDEWWLCLSSLHRSACWMHSAPAANTTIAVQVHVTVVLIVNVTKKVISFHLATFVSAVFSSLCVYVCVETLHLLFLFINLSFSISVF